jgi:hypothetical protein
MRRAATIIALLSAVVLAACGSSGPSAKSASDVLVDDWTGAHDAIPHVKWTRDAARLDGTLIDGEPSCAKVDATRFRCSFRVTRADPAASARVTAVVTFASSGAVTGWVIESVG